MFFIIPYASKSINLNAVRSFQAYGSYLEFEYNNNADTFRIQYKDELTASKTYRYLIKRMAKRDPVIYDRSSLEDYSDRAVLDGSRYRE